MMKIFFAIVLALTPQIANAQFSSQQTYCIGACVGGTANVITLAIPNVTALGDLKGVPIRFVPAAPNTGATTISVSGLPAIPVDKPGFSGPVPLVGGELPALSTVTMVYDGTEFIFTAGGFINGGPALSAPVSYFVSNSGSDNNNCLSLATPCLTIQHVLVLVNKLNLNGYTVTINLADGTYAPVTLPLINGSGQVIITGDAVNPAATIISNPTAGSAINAASTTGYVIQNVLLQTIANGPLDPGAGVWTAGANITLVNVDFGPCSGGYINATSGLVSLFGTFVISGGVSGNALVSGAGFFAGGGALILVSPAKIAMTITVPITVTYFYLASQSGSISIVFSTLTGAGNVTGTKYFTQLNGTIFTGGACTTVPGSISGSGQCL